MDTLRNISRSISKLIREGKTTKEIMEILNVKEFELYDILKSNYSERYYNDLFRKLKQNDIYDKTEILVDTSALKVDGMVEYLLKYCIILIHVNVIREMDKKKKEGSCFGFNIRTLLKLCAEDYNSVKFKVITSEEVSSYPDENLIYYLRKESKQGKNIILITDDNALACIAKGYGIKYILARELDNKKTNKHLNRVKSNNKTTKKENNIKKNINLEFVRLMKDVLYLFVPTGKEDSFIVLDKGEIKNYIANNIILKTGDEILQLFNTKKGKLKIQKFKITDALSQKCAQDLGFDIITSIEQIEKLPYTNSVKLRIRHFFNLNKKA